MTLDAWDVIEPDNFSTGTSSCTTLNDTAEATNGPKDERKMPDLLLILGLVFTVGTGGFAKPSTASSTSIPSSSQIWVATRHRARGASAPNTETYNVEAIVASERVAEVRQQLSLNVKQLADAMQVERPTVYGWISGSTPRENQQLRLKELYDIALKWKTLSDIPVGKYLIAPLDGGVSLLALLRAPRLDRTQIELAMTTISSTIRVAQDRKQASGYKSAASVMKARGIRPVARGTQQQRLDDTVDLG